MRQDKHDSPALSKDRASGSTWYHLALFSLGCFSFLPFYRLFQVGSINDEGIIAVGAVRLLSGEALYADFYTHIAPGSYYLCLLAYSILGPTVEATRLLAALVTGGLGLSIYLLGQRVLGPRWALVPYALFLFCGVTQWPIFSYHWNGVLAFLLGTLALMRWYENSDRVEAGFACGATCALATWLLQSEAAALYLLTLLVTGLYWRRMTKKALCGWFIGLIGVSGLLWAPILWRATPAQIWQQNVLWALGHNASHGTSAYDPSGLLQLWSAFFGQLKTADHNLAVANWALHTLSYQLTWSCNYWLFYPVFLLVAVLVVKHEKDPMLRILVLSQTASILAWSSRQTMLYLNFLTPGFFLLFGYLLWRFRAKIVAVTLCGVYGVAYLYQYIETRSFIYPIPTVRGVVYASNPQLAHSYTAILRKAMELTPPGTPAFCYPYAMGFSYLSGIAPVSPFSSVIPVLGEAEQTPQLVQVLESQKTPYIYYFPWSKDTLTAVPNVDQGIFWETVKESDRAILKNYAPIEEYGIATVYQRKPQR